MNLLEKLKRIASVPKEKTEMDETELSVYGILHMTPAIHAAIDSIRAQLAKIDRCAPGHSDTVEFHNALVERLRRLEDGGKAPGLPLLGARGAGPPGGPS